jgi:hypothetical protein
MESVMKALVQRWRLVGLLILAISLTAGCNLASMAYFLTTGFAEPKEQPGEMKLASSEKEIKVVVITHANKKTSDFARVDTELAGLLVKRLQHYCADNKEKVTFVSANKVEDYKASHPNWFLNPGKVGEHFSADKVIFLEVDSISLYEQGSSNQLYRGRASITVKLFDLDKPDDFQIDKAYTCEYPRSRGPIAADDMPPRQFYLAFLNHMAKHLSWYFTAHPLSETVGCD